MAANKEKEIVIEMDQECIKFIKDKIGELKGRIDGAAYYIDKYIEEKAAFEKRLEIYCKILDRLNQISKDK